MKVSKLWKYFLLECTFKMHINLYSSFPHSYFVYCFAVMCPVPIVCCCCASRWTFCIQKSSPIYTFGSVKLSIAGFQCIFFFRMLKCFNRELFFFRQNLDLHKSTSNCYWDMRVATFLADMQIFIKSRPITSLLLKTK